MRAGELRLGHQRGLSRTLSLLPEGELELVRCGALSLPCQCTHCTLLHLQLHRLYSGGIHHAPVQPLSTALKGTGRPSLETPLSCRCR